MPLRHAILAALCAAATTALASAYTTIGYWGSNNVTMRASSVSFPTGSAYRTALGTVVTRVNNNPSQFWFTQQYGDTSVAFNNGQNEVWFSSSATYDPAVTFTWYSFWPWELDKIVEADVVFYSGESYTTSMSKLSLWGYGGGYRPFQTTAIHEYGHAAGLGHENDEYNVMGSDWTHIHLNGSTCRSYLGEDAADGLVSIYGLVSSGYEDLSVSHWKYSGASGEYSTHALCKMYTTGGSELSWSSYEGMRRYNVTKGSSVQIEFSYENNGRTTQSRPIGIYVSTNSTISTSDTLIKTVTPTLGRNDVYTVKYTITIPSTLTSGATYWIGAYMDKDKTLSEVDESNNAAYHVVKVN